MGQNESVNTNVDEEELLDKNYGAYMKVNEDVDSIQKSLTTPRNSKYGYFVDELYDMMLHKHLCDHITISVYDLRNFKPTHTFGVYLHGNNMGIIFYLGDETGNHYVITKGGNNGETILTRKCSNKTIIIKIFFGSKIHQDLLKKMFTPTSNMKTLNDAVSELNYSGYIHINDQRPIPIMFNINHNKLYLNVDQKNKFNIHENFTVDPKKV
jgi:hypothetical protein